MSATGMASHREWPSLTRAVGADARLAQHMGLHMRSSRVCDEPPDEELVSPDVGLQSSFAALAMHVCACRAHSQAAHNLAVCESLEW